MFNHKLVPRVIYFWCIFDTPRGWCSNLSSPCNLPTWKPIDFLFCI